MALGSGGIGQQGMALLQAALRARSPGGMMGSMGGQMPGASPIGGGGMQQPGLLAQLFNQQQPGGPNGLLAKMRALSMPSPSAGAPMSLAPPPALPTPPDVTMPW